MRTSVLITLALLTVALAAAVVAACQSRKAIAPPVAHMVCSLIPPVAGNLIIILSRNRALSTLGYYIYFLGMDGVMYCLLRFTQVYCRSNVLAKRNWIRAMIYALLALDAAQLLCNLAFRHAFGTEMILVEGSAYYRLLPYWGQTIHRVVDYGIFLSVLVVFFLKMVRSPRVYLERYAIIFSVMLVTGAWETYYIFSRTPVDWSMIGFGAFGLLVFYFSLYYRPVRLLDRILASIAQDMSSALFFFDAINRCVWVNEAGIRLVDLKENDFEQGSELVGQLFGGLDIAGSGWNCRRSLKGGEGERFYSLSKSAVMDDKERQVGSVLVIHDETEQQRALLKEKYNATHDNLTGLYTKEHLFDCVRETLRANPDTQYYLLYLDVNDFKIVNDVFGRQFGDHALRAIAEDLRQNLPAGCLYGRIAGDAFGVCMPEALFDPKLGEGLSQLKVQKDAMEHLVVFHQGVYRITEPELDVSVMFDRAHMALESIKDDYKRHVAFYDDAMRNEVLWSQAVATQLSGALKEKQIQPYLQAMVDRSGRVVGAEALVRWVHPQSGLLPPSRFIPVLERNGMIADMDRHMWRCACNTLAQWQREGHTDMFISVNVSPKDFYFMDVVGTLSALVREYEIKPACLRVEFTETVMMTGSLNRLQILSELKKEGFMVEMDDFGSGYSSLNMLKDMPVDAIKIDRLFLDQAKDSLRAQTILRNILTLSEDLGIVSVTEGVETEAQFRMLADMGSQLFQGFYFSRPMPVEQFEASFLSERRAE